MTEWIPVIERLPKDGQMIVYCYHCIECASVGRYCGKDDPMPSAPYWLSWDKVTHWMPLPEMDK